MLDSDMHTATTTAAVNNQKIMNVVAMATGRGNILEFLIINILPRFLITAYQREI